MPYVRFSLTGILVKEVHAWMSPSLMQATRMVHARKFYDTSLLNYTAAIRQVPSFGCVGRKILDGSTGILHTTVSIVAPAMIALK